MSTSHHAGNRRRTEIKFDDVHVASISRDAFDAIADHPVFDDQLARPGAKVLTFRAVLEKRPPRDTRRRVRFKAGLSDRVANALTSAGINVRMGKQPALWPWTNAQLNVPTSGFLVRAAGRPRWLGIVPKRAEQIRLVSQLCELQPDEHVLVVARNNHEASAVAEALTAATGRPASWGFNQRYGHPWLHVNSIQALSGCCTMHWGFVVFLDAESALTKTAMEFLKWSLGSVRVGFLVGNERRLLETERSVLEAFFGPVVYRPGDDSCLAEVTVAWLQPRDCQPRAIASNLDRKRKQIWTNDSRNRLIARAARALHDCNFVALEMLGLKEAARSLIDEERTDAPTVAIVAENLEHAQQLSRLLPGWRLEAAGYTAPAGELVIHDRLIVTLPRALETLLTTSITIFGAAGPAWLEHANFASHVWSSEHSLIVDIADRADERSVAETRSRAAEYRQQGFRVLSGCEPILRDLAQKLPGKGSVNLEALRQGQEGGTG